MQHTGFQQVNMLAEQICADMIQQQQNILQLIENNHEPEEEPPPQQANAVQQDQQQVLIELICALTSDACNRRPGTRRNNNKKYCWSHGMCGHIGEQCRNPKEGHKSEATKNNRMDGSNKGCGDDE